MAAEPELSDEQILEMTEKLKQDEYGSRPLISAPLPLSDLMDEYASGSEVVRAKIAALEGRLLYRSLGDGNCFYRAFACGWTLSLLKLAAAERQKAADLLQGLQEILLAQGYEKLAYEDFLDAAMEIVRVAVAGGPDAHQTILALMQDPQGSNSFVVYLRFVTACWMRSQSELYSAYAIDSNMDFDRYVTSEVEAMGCEADQPSIHACVSALQARIIVHYLDGHPGPLNTHEMASDTPSTVPAVELLYRPGHYDLLQKI